MMLGGQAETPTSTPSIQSPITPMTAPTGKETLRGLKILIQESLSRFASLTEEYLDALSPATETPQSTASRDSQIILAELVEVDRQLAARLDEANALSDLHQQLEGLRDANRKSQEFLDRSWKTLFDMEERLETTLLRMHQSPPSKPVCLDTLLMYSRRLGRTTFASPPPTDAADSTNLARYRAYQPPAPQEDMMRAGLLYQEQTNPTVDMSQAKENGLKQKPSPTRVAEPLAHFIHTVHHSDLLEDDWLAHDLNPDLS